MRSIAELLLPWLLPDDDGLEVPGFLVRLRCASSVRRLRLMILVTCLPHSPLPWIKGTRPYRFSICPMASAMFQRFE